MLGRGIGRKGRARAVASDAFHRKTVSRNNQAIGFMIGRGARKLVDRIGGAYNRANTGAYNAVLGKSRTKKLVAFGRRRRGKGGAKKGHEFFGNQYTKVSKYTRKKGKAIKRHVSRNKKAYRRAGAVGV